MATLVEIATAVAGELADYNAQVVFCPEFELSDLEQMKVCVVPFSVSCKTLSRTSHEETMKIQIGFLKRGCEDDIDELLVTVEEIGMGFLGKKLVNAVCIGVAYNPIYSPEHLRERGQFTSVIELSFTKID